MGMVAVGMGLEMGLMALEEVAVVGGKNLREEAIRNCGKVD